MKKIADHVVEGARKLVETNKELALPAQIPGSRYFMALEGDDSIIPLGGVCQIEGTLYRIGEKKE